jgi:hypothetical protein
LTQIRGPLLLLSHAEGSVCRIAVQTLLVVCLTLSNKNMQNKVLEKGDYYARVNKLLIMILFFLERKQKNSHNAFFK